MNSIQEARDVALDFASFHDVGEEDVMALAEDWFDSGIGDDDLTREGLVKFLTSRLCNGD